LSDLEKRIFLNGYRKALAFGGGECDICDACNIQSGLMSCRYPEISRPSMESCGIDVFETAIKAKYKINILKTKSEDFCWFGMILID
jgi:predicted metal-binding protein